MSHHPTGYIDGCILLGNVLLSWRTLFDQWKTYFRTQYLLCTHLLPLTVLLLSLFSTIIQWTPLHASSMNGHAQVVDMLLSQPGIVVDSRDEVW